MPFADRFDAIWEDVIRATVVAFGDVCVRADDLFKPGVVMVDVASRITQADYLIADLTGQRANVFYELGYAHALHKPVILITQEIIEVPLDVSHQRILPYTDTVAGGRQLRQSLSKCLSQLV
jgi:hypothetical protein